MWFNKKKKQFPRFWSFRFCPVLKIENSEISKSLILLKILAVYETQNRKNYLKERPLTLRCSLRRKNVNFRGFQVFDFALYLKSEIWKSRKVFIYFNFLSFPLHQACERLKPFNDFQMNTHLMPSCPRQINKDTYVKRFLFMDVSFSMTYVFLRILLKKKGILL